MTPHEEDIYVRGSRAAWVRMLAECIRQLGTDAPLTARWLLEREETIAQLRILCERVGDNDWSTGLHLADVVEKHLARHLP